MGKDKGLIEDQGIIRARIVFDLLSTIVSSVSISIRSDQNQSYSSHFTEQEMIEDDSELLFRVMGPMRGLLSSHLTMPDRDFLVLACDLKDMGIEPLELLLKFRNENKGQNFYIARTSDGIEPLCGIYTASGLQSLYEEVAGDNVSDFSLMRYLINQDAFIVNIPEKWKYLFKNHNFPES